MKQLLNSNLNIKLYYLKLRKMQNSAIMTSPPTPLLQGEGCVNFAKTGTPSPLRRGRRWVRFSQRASLSTILRNFSYYLLFTICYLTSASLVQAQNVDSAFNTKHTAKDPDTWDVHLFRSVNNNRSKFKDAVMPNMSNSVVPMAILMPISLFTYGRANEKTFDENSGCLLALSEVTDIGLTVAIKYIVKRKRPYESLSNVNRGDDVTKDPYSFPSGHTSTTFSMATLFALRYPKYPQTYVPMYVWAMIVAYSRPYLGIHYPSDLLGGAIIGAGSSILIYSLRSQLFKFKNNLLNEKNNDDGSVNGGVITVFAGSFLLSEIVNYFFFDNKSSMIIGFGSNTNSSSNQFQLRYKF